MSSVPAPLNMNANAGMNARKNAGMNALNRNANARPALNRNKPPMNRSANARPPMNRNANNAKSPVAKRNALSRAANMAKSGVNQVSATLKSQWSNRVVQLSLYAAVMFYIVANPEVFKFMMQFLPKDITRNNQLLVHAVLFAVLVYVGSMYLFDPLAKKLGLK
tara:strand:- start:251 stop:742 length:492 start_codon:yes stop_codon:yes gene_type:complete